MPDYSTTGAVFPLKTYAITDVDTGTEQFVIDGDQTERFEDGALFSVVDSTGNDGEYTVASTSYSEVNDETTITVDEDITDATVDGTVIHREVADSLPITESHDDADDRDAAAPEEYAGAHGQRIANELKALGKTVGEGLGLEVVNGGGLVVYYTGGKVLKGSGTPVFVSTGKLTMTDNDDNYVEVNIAGTVSSNLVGFTTGKYPLAIVTTLAGVITNINDTRSVIYLAEFAEANLDAFGPSFNAPTELTIASDAVTRTQGVHRIDTEGDAAADDLSTISGTAADYLLYIRSENAARVVTLKDGIGNLDLNGQDIVLDDPGIFIGLIYDSVISKWVLAGGGGGGGIASPSVVNRIVKVKDISGGIEQSVGAVLTNDDDMYALRRVGIGPDADPALYPLHVQDDTITPPGGFAPYAAFYPTITAGGTVADFDIAMDAQITLNHPGGTHGQIIGTEGVAILTDGNVGSVAQDAGVFGITGFAEVDGGQVWGEMAGGGSGVAGYWSGFGIYGGTVEDAAGLYIYGEVNGGTVSGDAYMLYLDEIAGIDYGIYQNGTADNYFGGNIGIGPNADPPLYPLHIQDDTITTAGDVNPSLVNVEAIRTGGGSAITHWNNMAFMRSELNHNGGTYGNMETMILETYLTDGTIGSGAGDRRFKTLEAWLEQDGGVAYGGAGYEGADAISAGVGFYGGTLHGPLRALYVYGEVDGGTVDDDAYMIYLDEINGMDWGIYQNGSADNYLGGALEVVGILTATGGLSLNSPSELTIDASGIITVTGPYHRVDTFADAAADDLVTINGGVDGELVRFRAENTARVVTLKDGTGNLDLGADIVLDNVRKVVTLLYDATLAKWLRDNGA